MAKVVALPVVLPAGPVFSQDVTHHIYVSQRDSSIADELALRSLFLTNIPVATTDLHLRHLFGNQLGGGLVEKVWFQQEALSDGRPLPDPHNKSSKKRKRITAEELDESLTRHPLPDVWENTLHTSSKDATVTFVDRPSMDASFKAAKKAAKSQKMIVWGKGIEDRLPVMGEKFYRRHNSLQYPTRQELLRHSEEYLTVYAEMEEAKARENSKKRQMPDEDGFVTVMKGSRGFVRKEDAEARADKAKGKTTGFDNFYRFQMREKRKGEQGDLIRKFEEDKRRVEEMKIRRGRLRPE